MSEEASKKLVKLVKKRELMDQEIELLLGNLGGCGDMCSCNRELGSVKLVHAGNLFYEVTEYCLACGGLIEHE